MVFVWKTVQNGFYTQQSSSAIPKTKSQPNSSSGCLRQLSSYLLNRTKPKRSCRVVMILIVDTATGIYLQIWKIATVSLHRLHLVLSKVPQCDALHIFHTSQRHKWKCHHDIPKKWTHKSFCKNNTVRTMEVQGKDWYLVSPNDQRVWIPRVEAARAETAVPI